MTDVPRPDESPAAPVAPRLLTRAEAALALRIGITNFKQLVKTGTIAHVTIGRRVLIEPAALDDYVDRLRAEQNGNGRTNRGRDAKAPPPRRRARPGTNASRSRAKKPETGP